MRLLFAVAVLAASLPAAAILIRPDRDDAEYQELATKYPAAVLLNAPDGEGVLIAPRWILTAAHMVKALEELKPLPRITIGKRSFEIQSMHANPDYRKGNPASDIGLIYLKRAVDTDDVEPVLLYKEKDEGGKTVIIVGHGYTGKIGGKPLPKEQWDRKKRAAINTIERVSPRTLGLKIKPPEEASDLQGAAAPGDSGGPAFVETPDGVRVIGIGSATDDTNANGIVGDPGDWEIHVRVSFFVPWIEAVMVGVARDELRRTMDPYDTY
jgi:hypothetical protein